MRQTMLYFQQQYGLPKQEYKELMNGFNKPNNWRISKNI